MICGSNDLHAAGWRDHEHFIALWGWIFLDDKHMVRPVHPVVFCLFLHVICCSMFPGTEVTLCGRSGNLWNLKWWCWRWERRGKPKSELSTRTYICPPREWKFSAVYLPPNDLWLMEKWYLISCWPSQPSGVSIAPSASVAWRPRCPFMQSSKPPSLPPWPRYSWPPVSLGAAMVNCEPWSSQRGRLADFHRPDHPVQRAVQYLLPGDSQVGVNVRPRSPHLLGPFYVGPGMYPRLTFPELLAMFHLDPCGSLKPKI